MNISKTKRDFASLKDLKWIKSTENVDMIYCYMWEADTICLSGKELSGWSFLF